MSDLRQDDCTATRGAGGRRDGTGDLDAVPVPLRLDSPVPLGAAGQPVTVGLPLPRGLLREAARACLVLADGREVPVQIEPLARWSDGSVQWLLCDFLADRLPAGVSTGCLLLGRQADHATGPSSLQVREDGGRRVIQTGPFVFEVPGSDDALLRAVSEGGDKPAGGLVTRVVLHDRRGRTCGVRVDSVQVETAGPIRATVRLEGRFERHRWMRFSARAHFFASTGLVRLSVTIHNPRRARHPGGLWDLGDPGSFLFDALLLETGLLDDGEPEVLWKAEPGELMRPAGAGGVEIYQDSSGGHNWRSRNHVNRDGRVPCRFRGCQVLAHHGQSPGRLAAEVLRASPVVVLQSPTTSLAVAVPEFWQQFPKAVEAQDRWIRVGLFPGQWDDHFELQPGERKTHTVWLRLGAGEKVEDDAMDWVHRPLVACATPEWHAASGAVPWLAPADADPDPRLSRLLEAALAGPESFVAKREVIDEYGWRNYGDVWADHEDAYYDGPKPVISHYNNQFDVVGGALIALLRTADRRWFELADSMARHVMDIDIYHTERDKATYSGGLFWFTDHYRDAATSTHRTYSRANTPADGSAYGGGPGCEHNFAMGLRYYYYLTGDRDAREAVIGLAEWVLRADDGAGNVLGPLDDGPTGVASIFQTSDRAGPARAAANSIEVLLDAWLITRQERLLGKVRELIRRCVHPDDDPDELDLLNAEHHWSYTMFLSALARYLDLEAERGELGFHYAYARASLVAYAAWMVQHERPYLDHPEALEYPTEAWAAQEFRKASVLRLAAQHAQAESATAMIEKAESLWERAWSDLAGFSTRHVARAVAVLMQEGPREAYFRGSSVRPAPSCEGQYDFGEPAGFVGQKARVRGRLGRVAGWVWLAGRVVRPARWRRLLGLVGCEERG